jgi:hypothetical protein
MDFDDEMEELLELDHSSLPDSSTSRNSINIWLSQQLTHRPILWTIGELTPNLSIFGSLLDEICVRPHLLWNLSEFSVRWEEFTGQKGRHF